MSAEPSVWVRRNGTFTLGVAYFARDRPSGWTAVGEPFYSRATLDAAVAAARAEERAKWQPAIALAQQCIAAAYEDRWPEFDRLSDDFDDACADAVLPMKPAAAIRNIKPE